MNHDPRQFIGLIIVSAGAIVLGLSYVAAYLIGRSHGRSEADRMLRDAHFAQSDDRIALVERNIGSISNSVERLMDAQRLLVAQQEHMGRKLKASPASPDVEPRFGQIASRHTPA